MSVQQENRVLSRRNARELTLEEVLAVSGGLHTTTKCSITANGSIDGDPHECGQP